MKQFEIKIKPHTTLAKRLHAKLVELNPLAKEHLKISTLNESKTTGSLVLSIATNGQATSWQIKEKLFYNSSLQVTKTNLVLTKSILNKVEDYLYKAQLYLDKKKSKTAITDFMVRVFYGYTVNQEGDLWKVHTTQSLAVVIYESGNAGTQTGLSFPAITSENFNNAVSQLETIHMNTRAEVSDILARFAANKVLWMELCKNYQLATKNFKEAK